MHCTNWIKEDMYVYKTKVLKNFIDKSFYTTIYVNAFSATNQKLVSHFDNQWSINAIPYRWLTFDG